MNVPNTPLPQIRNQPSASSLPPFAWSPPLRRCLWLILILLGLGARPDSLPAAEDKLDLDSLLNDKERILKAETEEAGPGDNKEFTIRTDDNISALEVGDVYRSEQKTFFKVARILSKGTEGGTFVLQRTAGKTDPDRKFNRVSGVGPVSIVARFTLFDLYLLGGVFMHPIAALGVAAILLGLNSLWIYRRKVQIPPAFVTAAQDALAAGDLARFEDLALKERGLFPVICRALVDRWDTSMPEEIKSRAEVVAGQQIARLRIPVKALNLIAAAAPLLGLLGTIVGMVIVFEAVASSTGVAKAQALAAGIRVKLFCTAMALCVAIPTLFLFFIFNQKLGSLIAQCEVLTEQFLHQLVWLKRKARLRPREDFEPDRARPRPARPRKTASTRSAPAEAPAPDEEAPEEEIETKGEPA